MYCFDNDLILGLSVRAAVDFARSEGVGQAYSMGLSNFSQRIFRKMGFKEKDRIEFKDYTQVSDKWYALTSIKYLTRISQDGESVFDLGKMGEHTSGVLFMANIGIGS